jgi:hypothetical protein
MDSIRFTVGPAASHTYMRDSQLTLDWSYDKVYLKCKGTPWVTIPLTGCNIEELLDESDLIVFRKLQLATIQHKALNNSPYPTVSTAVRNLSTL